MTAGKALILKLFGEDERVDTEIENTFGKYAVAIADSIEQGIKQNLPFGVGNALTSIEVLNAAKEGTKELADEIDNTLKEEITEDGITTVLSNAWSGFANTIKGFITSGFTGEEGITGKYDAALTDLFNPEKHESSMNDAWSTFGPLALGHINTGFIGEDGITTKYHTYLADTFDPEKHQTEIQEAWQQFAATITGFVTAGFTGEGGITPTYDAALATLFDPEKHKTEVDEAWEPVDNYITGYIQQGFADSVMPAYIGVNEELFDPAKVQEWAEGAYASVGDYIWNSMGPELAEVQEKFGPAWDWINDDLYKPIKGGVDRSIEELKNLLSQYRSAKSEASQPITITTIKRTIYESSGGGGSGGRSGGGGTPGPGAISEGITPGTDTGPQTTVITPDVEPDMTAGTGGYGSGDPYVDTDVGPGSPPGLTPTEEQWLDTIDDYLMENRPHMMAEGGIVKKPTLGMMGEAGDEAVIPLNQASGLLGQQELTIELDGDVIARKVISRLERRVRVRGAR